MSGQGILGLPRDGGALAAAVLARHGVDTVFTLSGGHLFPLYDGCVKSGIRLVDTRHEQTATFAAEGLAKVTRRVGVAAVTAGPGVTNAVSAIAAAHMSGSPLVVIGGRAPERIWGLGSLQELDHVPIVASITKLATTAKSPERIGAELDRALHLAVVPHRGPTFVDVPIDEWGPLPEGAADDLTTSGAEREHGDSPDSDDIAAVATLVRDAARPVLMVGTDAYWAVAEDALRGFAEAALIPVFGNDLGRGLLPADHDLAFSRARTTAFRNADLVVVAGTPLDFRLGFGRFGDARVVHLADTAAGVSPNIELAGSVAGDLAATFAALAEHAPRSAVHQDWVQELRGDETKRRAAEQDRLESAASPIDPARVYGELRKRLARDAIVIGDGGDFVSYTGKWVDTFAPGCFLGPGPFGCLGSGTGYALAAACAHPDRQIVVCFGDGAIGFSLGDLDSLVRHDANVTAIVGNNGIWGLEKHPMQAVYGYDVVAELRPGTRYDEVAIALGGHGELVSEPDEIGPALDRAFAHRGLSVVNVLTDPADVYPRSSRLG